MSLLEVPIRGFGGFTCLKSSDTRKKNCNIYCRPKNSSSYTFFAVKVDRYDVKPGICLYENLCTDSWVDVTSVNFNSKKVLEDKISADKIYYNFSHEHLKISNNM